MKYDKHCKQAACPCDHTACYMGWTGDQTYSTTPCHYCRPSTFERWFQREQARAKDYPMESLNRIMQAAKRTA